MSERSAHTTALRGDAIVSILWGLSVVVYACLMLSDYIGAVGNEDAFIQRDRPMPTNFDGWYYLRLAREWTGDEYVVFDELRGADRPASPPLLSLMAAGAKTLTGATWEGVAYVMPPIAALLLLPIMAWCGVLLRDRVVSAIAPLAAVSTMYWYLRVRPGFFDTDCLNPVFMVASSLLLHCFTVNRTPARFLLMGAYFCVLALFLQWWAFGVVMTLGLGVVAYSATFRLPSMKMEKAVKLGAAACFLIGLFVAAGEFFGLWTTGNKDIELFLKLIALVMGVGREDLPVVGPSVMELQPLSPAAFMTGLSSFFPTVVLACVGFVLLAVRKPVFATFMLPSLALGLGGLLSGRFLIFLTPVYALGYAAFFSYGVQKLLPKVGRHSAVWILLALPPLVPSYLAMLNMPNKPPISAEEVMLTDALRDAAVDDTLVWNWWDFGYFIQYISELPTIIDPGDASSEEVFRSSAPLAATDPRVAAGLFSFFRDREYEDFQRFASSFPSKQQALAELKAMAAADPAAADARELFDSQGDILLYLNRNMLDITFWWHSFGTWDFRPGGPDPQEKAFVIDRYEAADMSVDADRGVVRRFDGAELRIRSLAEVVEGEATATVYDAGSDAAGSGVACVVYRDDPAVVYLMPMDVYNSIVFRLFFHPEGTEPYFEQIAFDPNIGGVWRVHALQNP